MAAYLTPQNLTDAWGAETMRQLFDDTNTGVLNANAITLVITRASARTTAWFGDTYDGVLPFPSPVPEMAQECAFTYALYFAFPRNPDYMRGCGYTLPALLKQADALGEQLQDAVLRMVDAPAPVPDNVGGAVESNDPNEGFRPKPWFFNASMGDY